MRWQLGIFGVFALTASLPVFQTRAADDHPAAPTAPAPATATTMGAVERLDPKLDDYVAKEAKIEKLSEGFTWAEGPVWVKDGGYLLFSDVPGNVVHRWSEGKGVSEFLKPSGFTGKTPPPEGTKEPGSNGLAIGPDGLLTLCQHGDRRVARLGKNGMFETLAEKYEGKRFNSPNDLCFDKAGNLYFTDPPYGLPADKRAQLSELKFNGVYRLGKDGKLTLLSKDMTFPNGIALSPDEKTLYVAQSDPKSPVIMAFALDAAAGTVPAKVFFDATAGAKAGKKGMPDGLKIAADGTLFATGPGGVYLISPDGKHLGTISPGDWPTANCAFGDADGKTLYMTSNHMICRIKLAVKGNGF
jgi:gluconolactonase